MKYIANIVDIGSNVKDMLQDGLLILFDETAPEDLKPYCVITAGNNDSKEIKIGDQLTISDYTYQITAIGMVANENLSELGHVTLCFDGADEAQLPGHIHVTPGFKSNLSKEGKIYIK